MERQKNKDTVNELPKWRRLADYLAMGGYLSQKQIKYCLENLETADEYLQFALSIPTLNRYQKQICLDKQELATDSSNYARFADVKGLTQKQFIFVYDRIRKPFDLVNVVTIYHTRLKNKDIKRCIDAAYNAYLCASMLSNIDEGLSKKHKLDLRVKLRKFEKERVASVKETEETPSKPNDYVVDSPPCGDNDIFWYPPPPLKEIPRPIGYMERPSTRVDDTTSYSPKTQASCCKCREKQKEDK